MGDLVEKLEVLQEHMLPGKAIIYFPLEAVHIVADIAGARKKRRLSPEAKSRLIEQGKAHRFLPQTHEVETPEPAQI